MTTQLKARQDTFDLVAFKLIQQGGPASARGGGACRYRTPEGKRCAAGHLIPDAEYHPDQEYKKASTVACLPNYYGNLAGCTTSPTLAALANYVGGAFLDDLQAAHDDAAARSLPHYTDDAWLAEWRDNMRALAERYGLDASILTWRESVA